MSEKKENVISLRKKIEREAKQNIHNQFSQMDNGFTCRKMLQIAATLSRGANILSRHQSNF